MKAVVTYAAVALLSAMLGWSLGVVVEMCVR